MPTIVIPSGFSLSDSGIDDASRRPAITLRNEGLDTINAHFVTDGIVRVVFCPGVSVERQLKPVVFEQSEIAPILVWSFLIAFRCMCQFLWTADTTGLWGNMC